MPAKIKIEERMNRIAFISAVVVIRHLERRRESLIRSKDFCYEPALSGDEGAFKKLGEKIKKRLLRSSQ